MEMMLCVLLQSADLPALANLDSLSTKGVLIVGMVFLWRAFQAKDAEAKKARQQMYDQSKLIAAVPEALDRLREEIRSGVRS